MPPSPVSNKKGYRNAVAILATFDKKEQKNLLQFLDSTYCTGLAPDHDCIILIRTLLKLLQKADPKIHEDEQVYLMLYPKQVFVANKYNRLMSDAQALLKRFVVMEQVLPELDDDVALLHQARYWRKKQEREHFEKVSEQLGKRQQERTKWEGGQYYWNYLVEQEKVEYNNDFNQHKGDVNLPEAIQALDEFYLIERIFSTCCLLTQNQVTEMSLPNPLLPFEPTQFPWFATHPLGQLLYQTLQCLQPGVNDSDASFGQFQALLQQQQNSLSDRYADQLEFVAGNYFTRQINRGHVHYQQNLFQLFQQRVAGGRIYRQGKVMANEFQSIVAIALKVRALDWAGAFIEAHKDKITGTEYPENAYLYNYCDYLFHRFCYPDDPKATKNKADLKVILPLINQMHYQDMQYKRAARVLEIKTIYENEPTEEFDFLFDKIQAMRTFLTRDEFLPAEKKEGYNLFAKAVLVLLKYQTAIDRNPNTLAALSQEVMNSTFVVAREWLLEKIKELQAPGYSNRVP